LRESSFPWFRREIPASFGENPRTLRATTIWRRRVPIQNSEFEIQRNVDCDGGGEMMGLRMKNEGNSEFRIRNSVTSVIERNEATWQSRKKSEFSERMLLLEAGRLWNRSFGLEISMYV
jgi:hypothetical protein